MSIELSGAGGTEVILELDMPVRYTAPHTMIEELTGQAAVERGPLVYCLESEDVQIDTLDDLYLDLKADFKTVQTQIQDRTVTALEGEMYRIDRENLTGRTVSDIRLSGMEHTKVRMIPYFAWDNREFGEMRIWLPVAYR